MNPIIIGISGKKRAGKNTVALMLAEIAKAQGYTTHELAFADAVKEEVSQVCNLPIEFMEREHNKEVFRPMYQWWATEFRRQFHGQDYWTAQLAPKIRRILSDEPNPFITITDVRFPDEIPWLKQFDGIVLRVTRPGTPGDNHKSETILDDYPFKHVIHNDGDTTELRMQARAWWIETFERQVLPPEVTAMSLL